MSERDYRILFGGEEIPAYQAWDKLEVAKEALEVLARFNDKWARLATRQTEEAEEEVRKRLGSIEVLLPAPPRKDPDMSDKARAMLLSMTPEEAIDVLASEHNMDCDINGLIHLAGTDAYLQSLANEAVLFQQNAILPEQIANLWNEAHRPAPGKPFWDRFDVERLLGGGEGS
jgi:hypothetical protein